VERQGSILPDLRRDYSHDMLRERLARVRVVGFKIVASFPD
jgi:hypothetical protein